jgi:hypothetical protein
MKKIILLGVILVFLSSFAWAGEIQGLGDNAELSVDSSFTWAETGKASTIYMTPVENPEISQLETKNQRTGKENL